METKNEEAKPKSIRELVIELCHTLKDRAQDMQDYSDNLQAATQLMAFEAQETAKIANAHSAKLLVEHRAQNMLDQGIILNTEEYRNRLHKALGVDRVANPMSDLQLIQEAFKKKLQ